jgi:hypothetical protein
VPKPKALVATSVVGYIVVVFKCAGCHADRVCLSILCFQSVRSRSFNLRNQSRTAKKMSPSAIISQADQTAPTNGHDNGAQVERSTPNPVYLTTEPKEDFDWKITLKGKVVAITGANRGR